jgi:SHS family lactate transporter-like MFS transporter
LLTFLFFSVAGGDQHQTTIQTSSGPKVVPDYAFVQGIFIGVIAAYVIVLTLLGPENHGSHFERSKTAFQAGASKEGVNSAPEDLGLEKSSLESNGKEKGEIQHVEDRRRV